MWKRLSQKETMAGLKREELFDCTKDNYEPTKR
jgi:hypothetical protein